MIKISNVRVMGMDDGNVIVQSQNKPEYGHIVFEQLMFVNNRGFWNKKHRTAFMAGRLDELHEMAELLNLSPGKELPGHLYIEESYVPFYESQMPKCNPTTGNAVLVNNKHVYMKTFYDEDGEKKDKLIEGIISIGSRLIEPREAIHIETTAVRETSNI